MATETWVINETLYLPAEINVTVEFESAGNKYSMFEFNIQSPGELMPYPYRYILLYDNVLTWYDRTWVSPSYRTITLDSPATGDFLTWLEANAVKQGGGEPVLNLVDRTALDSALTATADAIRAKTGGTADLTFDMDGGKGFEDSVAAIPGAKPEQSKTLTLGANAPQTVNPDSGKTLSSVPVELDTSVIKAENIAKDVQMLGIIGTHEGGTTPTLITKTVTANGVYSASADGADGYSQFTVSIPVYDGTVV